MGRTSGTYTLTSNIEPKVGAPLDARTIVKLLADLTANNTFEYPYKGMMVFVEENTKTYTLIGTDPTVSANWVESGASQVQTDWNQSDNTKVDYIKNKPENLVQDANYVHTDNNYDDTSKGKVDALGTASTKDVPTSGNASTTQVVMGNDTRLTDARTPVSHNHTVSDITDFPTLGTAAVKDVPSSGNADLTQVVMGNDTRLSDSRPASDVYSWAKASTKPSYAANEISGLGTAAIVDTTTSITQGGTGIPTAGAVWSAIDNLPEPMILKGTLGTGGTITSLPTAAADNEGHTYKVITAGIYAGQAAKVGDFFVSCKPVGASAYEWIWFPSGDESFTDTWRNVKVNGTEKLGTGISSGAVDFVNGTNTTVAFDASGNKISVSVPAVSSSSAGVAPKGAAVSSQSQSTKFLREDGTWAAPSYTTNTDRYVNSAAFAHDSTNDNIKMTLTRAGTDSATVTSNIPKVSSSSAGVAPKGATVSSQSQSTKFLREDGTWAAPSYTTDTNTKVTQTNSTANGDYRLLLSANANDTTETNTSIKSTNFKANPSTGLLTVKQSKSTVDKSMLTGTGTAAQDKGSGVSPRYFPAKWTFNTGITVADGDMFTIKIPVAGHSYGEFISVNNGTNYYPVGYNTNTLLTTHFPVGAIITVVFKSDGIINSIYPVAGGDAKVNVSGGAFYVLDLYDSGNSNTYDRNRYQGAIKVWGTALVAGNVIVAGTGTNAGLYMHLKQNAAFDITYPILYLNEAVAASGTTTNTYDILNIATATTQTGTWTAYKPVFIKGQLSGTTFTPISATPLTQTIPTTADGYEYILLGIATATTTVYLQERHPVYAYRNGKFGEIVNDADSVNGYTVAKSVPSNAVFTDTNTKVTAVANHYTPTCSGTFTASASGATAAWSIDVVKGVTLQKDAAGHITGVSVTSGKIPANPNTDTKVTAVANHYTPTCSGTYTASASGATAAWSIDVVKGVTLQKDAAGHITGISVTSGKIPANPNTDTNVTQTATTTNAAYEVLFSATADNTTRTEGARKNSNLKFNPSTGDLTVTSVNGLKISLVT